MKAALASTMNWLLTHKWAAITLLVLIVALVPGGMALAFALKTKLGI